MCRVSTCFVLGSQWTLRERSWDFPYSSWSWPQHSRTAFPTVSNPHLRGTFVIAETTLIHHHPKFIVYMAFILGGVHSKGLEKYIMTYIHHYNVQSIFTASVLSPFISPCSPSLPALIFLLLKLQLFEGEIVFCTAFPPKFGFREYLVSVQAEYYIHPAGINNLHWANYLISLSMYPQL